MSTPAGVSTAPPSDATPSTAAPVGPVVVTEGAWTVESGSQMTPTSVETVREALAAPAAEAAAPASVEPPPQASLEAPTADEAAAPEADKPAGKRDRVARLRAEIHALTRQKYETRAAIEQAQQRLQALQAELARRTATPAAGGGDRPAGAEEVRTPDAAAQEAAQPVHPDDVAAVGPAPTWQAYDEQGKTWDEYQAAYQAWLDRKTEARLAREVSRRVQTELDARIRAAQAAEAEAAARQAAAEAAAAYQAQLAEIEREDPTFDQRARAVLDQFPVDPQQPDFRVDVVQRHPAGVRVLKHWVDHPEELQALTQLQDRLTTAMMISVQAEADPIPLLSYLATHPQETTEIARLPRDHALRALRAISARVGSAVSSAPAPNAPTSVTRAAAPIRPVGGTRTTTIDGDEDHWSIEQLYAHRLKQAAREAAARRGGSSS